jgi:hypothetical protein
MITKAYIINKEQNSNKYYVRIPIFEKPGINSENSNLSRTHFSATLAHEPTIFDTYNIGDCVFVGFENNELNRPVIIGKLYTKNDTSATSGLIETKVLTVLDKTTLPADTTIGEINFANISNFFNSINDTLNKKDIFVDSIQLKTGVEGAGLVNFNDKEELAQITLSPNVTMAVGVDEVLKVYNDTDETLVDGTVVYRTGVKKETNVILDDYQLVVNGDLTLDSNSDGVPDGFSYINATDISLTNGIAKFTATARYGTLRQLTPNVFNVVNGNTYYFYSKIKSITDCRMLLNGIGYDTPVVNDGNWQFTSKIFTASSSYSGTGIRINDDSTSDWTPIEVDYVGAFNVSDMKLNGVKNDAGIPFTLLTNEQIKTQLDKWVQRGVSGTTKVKPSIANIHNISNSTIGVVTETIESHKYGFITRRGFVGRVLLDPNIYTIGQTLYLSSDVEGTFTNQRPVAPNFVTQIGYVNMVSSDSDTADGQIYVDIRIIPISSDIPYDNSDSDLESQTVKDALDEISQSLSDITPGFTPQAIDITTDVSQFNNILSSDDTNVQHALNTLDNHTHVLPISTTEQLGVVKTGTGLHVDVDGTLSVTVGELLEVDGGTI